MARNQRNEYLERWEESQNRLAPGETALDRMLSDMNCPSWQHRVRGEDGSVAAILPKVANHPSGSPEQRKLEDEWEQKSIQMHSQQTVITVPEKPTDAGTRGKYAVAAFEVQYADEPVVNFADSPAATGKHTTTKRSD